MKKSILHCTVISPMFSYGNQKVELRPSELKGLMRYIYRIANHQSRTELLYEAEGKRFGDAEKYASPVRMQMKMLDEKQVRQSLMLHKEAPDRNPRMLNFSAGTTFEIIIRTLSGTDIEGITHECYKDHVILSLVLGGLGKRTRRGRGCVTIAELNKNNQQLLFWVTEQLNTINEKNSSGGTPPYKNEKGEIVVAADLTKLQRPIIEKIKLGKEIKDIHVFLQSVDQASHNIKRYPPQCVQNRKYATGFAFGGRFASSVIVSVTQTSDGIFPIYTYVKAIYNGVALDSAYEERNEFIDLVEEGAH
ncbi:CRISPR-associated protein TM1795 family protein [Syntrophobotulus glycolicus DSM 8271]|uniref:CRISPR-associated protein TM1795 family protein n=1 Tax=Syntrophobotulus glycolicus (strain DSM 8271 / FlGlyR) TaxID=645991 RepID=F0SV81_SYNGF|nr:type III-B CRISPR module RAMP protein Cmr1 [Syntrophobotulus glycolicus]ADY55581.1 CRISPR-associated protein TM1795 family protein [Syntrophobotulus glycolicus DSM 8271]